MSAAIKGPEGYVPGSAQDFCDPVLAQAFAYWWSHRQAGRLPGRADIDPADITAILPWIFLVDVERDAVAVRFRFRLVGTGVAGWAGRDATGWALDEPRYGVQGDLIRRQYLSVVADGRPRAFVQYAPWFRHAADRTYCKLLLPLAADGVQVDMILGAFCEDQG